MSAYLFPDTSVLVNFASVSRLDLLEAVLDNRGRWCEAVENEVNFQARRYASLSTVAPSGWLGSALEITDPTEQAAVEQQRRAIFIGDPHRSLQHLGEAQTLFVIRNWSAYQGSTWVSEDNDSLEWARVNGIPTQRTRDLLYEANQLGKCSLGEGYDLIVQMRAEGHNPMLPYRRDQFYR